MKLKVFVAIGLSALLLLPVTIQAATLDDQLTTTQTTVASLKDQNNHLKEQQQSTENEVKNIQNRITHKAQELLQLQAEKRVKEQQIKEYAKSTTSVDMNQIVKLGPSQISQQVHHLSTTLDEQKAIQAELDMKEAAVQVIQHEIAGLKTTQDELYAEQKTLKQTIVTVAKQLERKQAEIADLKATIKEKNKFHFDSPLEGSLNISSGYGSREDPTGSSGTQHDGIDFTGYSGQKVMAARDGVVVEAQFGPTQGNCVIIKHDNGYYTYYMHLNSISVHAGQDVTAGQQVGTMGTTGSSTGVHLHFGMSTSVWGNYVNPTKFLGL